MDRWALNVLAMSGPRRYEAAGDVDTLLLDKTAPSRSAIGGNPLAAQLEG